MNTRENDPCLQPRGICSSRDLRRGQSQRGRETQNRRPNFLFFQGFNEINSLLQEYPCPISGECTLQFFCAAKVAKLGSFTTGFSIPRKLCCAPFMYRPKITTADFSIQVWWSITWTRAVKQKYVYNDVVGCPLPWQRPSWPFPILNYRTLP